MGTGPSSFWTARGGGARPEGLRGKVFGKEEAEGARLGAEEAEAPEKPPKDAPSSPVGRKVRCLWPTALKRNPSGARARRRLIVPTSPTRCHQESSTVGKALR